MAKDPAPESPGKEASSLTHNPFAGLAVPGIAPEDVAEAAARAEADKAEGAPPPWRVAKTKKGGYPVSVERRAGGKVMTLVRNVSGDADALLSALRKHCAAGGKALGDLVEIQGDHAEKITAFLREKG